MKATRSLPMRSVNLEEENDAICRAGPRVQAELAFQEAILSDIERTGEPVTGSRAAAISAEINRRYLRNV
jgi:hypothetical protein